MLWLLSWLCRDVAGGEVVEVDESLFEDVDDLTLEDDDDDANDDNIVDSVTSYDADSWCWNLLSVDRQLVSFFNLPTDFCAQ